jgi:hypothetical protein
VSRVALLDSVSLPTVAGSVCGCERTRLVSRSNVIRRERVVGSWSFAADVTHGCGISHDLRQSSVVGIVEFVVLGLAGFASGLPGRKGAAV